MRLAIDAMGGDYAPKEIVQGINRAVNAFPDTAFILFGDETQIRKELETSDRVAVIHTDEVISGTDEPVRAVRRKKFFHGAYGPSRERRGSGRVHLGRKYGRSNGIRSLCGWQD